MSIALLSITPLFPGPGRETEGLFVAQRLAGLPERYAARVVRASPWFPLLRPRRGAGAESWQDLRVEELPFFYLPVVWKGLDGPWLLRALGRLDAGEARCVDAHFGYPTGWAAVRWAHARGLPVTVTLRGNEVRLARDPRRRPRLEECIRAADRVITVSRSLAGLALDLGAREEHVRVVPNGVDRELFHPGDRSVARKALGLPQGAPLLLTVGGLTPRKGVERVLRVLPALMRSWPDLRFVVVGGANPEGDSSQSIKSLVRELGLGEAVVLSGVRAHHELPALYRAADVFVLASSNEGFANVLCEALACACPVVATDVGGNREVLEAGGPGRLVPPDDGAALEHALAAALEEGAGDGLPRFERSWGDVGREVAAVYDELLS